MKKTTFGQKNGQAGRGLDMVKCSGYARQRMGPKLMNCCRPEPMGTQEYGKMLKWNQVLEDGGVPAKEQEAGGLKDKKEESREKGIRGF